MASSAMAEFDKLPVAPKAPEKSPVNDFLDKVEEQEKTELEMMAEKDRASIRAAHKGTSMAAKESDYNSLLDNPISAMTAMQHPDLVKKAQHEDLESMARGEDALVETSLELRCTDKDLKEE